MKKVATPLRISNSDTRQAVIVDANDQIVGSLDRSLGAAEIVRIANKKARFGDVCVYIHAYEYIDGEWIWTIDLGDLEAEIVSGECFASEADAKENACKACEVLGLNVEGYT